MGGNTLSDGIHEVGQQTVVGVASLQLSGRQHVEPSFHEGLATDGGIR